MNSNSNPNSKNQNKNYINKDMYKSIIKLLDKASPSQSDVSLAWRQAKEVDKDLKWLDFRSIKGRNEYLTKIMKKSTNKIEEKLAFDEMKRMRKSMVEIYNIRKESWRNGFNFYCQLFVMDIKGSFVTL